MAARQMSSSDAVHDTEEDYGLIRPSLIKQLRSILDQYPDDGQILKELIQNAEDAGATQVKFLYDDNQYDTADLYHPDMAQFQGPSLLAYNNALFEEKDWTGIRLLQDSVKEKDPMKVGRFGLGFKSVLHMTDLPSVLSGDRLFMIDPHEKYFQYRGDKTSGYSWNLKQKQAAVAKIPNQFKPYMNVFGTSAQTFTEGFYNGTLFRFPLRTQVSDLSNTVYESDRMNELLSSFETDAGSLLLFLKHIESIQLYRRSRGQKEPELLFELRIAAECVNYVRKKRGDFVDKCRAADIPNGATQTYVAFIETIKYNPSVEKKVYKWLINEYRAGSNVSAELLGLQKDPSLALVPLVGVALLVNRAKPVKKIADAKQVSPLTESATPHNPEKDDENEPEGHVFCFLPLPMEQKTATGLPVHVNGYFAISQNRRHLKWPTTGHNVKSDKSIQWNQCLLRELVPLSYCQILLQAMQLSLKQTLIKPEDVYNAMPDLIKVDEKWQLILEPLYTSIFQHSVMYTMAQGGSWTGIGDVVFDCMKEDQMTSQIVTEVLLRSDFKVAKVPKHILHALGAYSQCSLEVISPSLVRTAMSSNPHSYQSVAREDKLSLLKYCLKDEDFQDMIGLTLLPLADGGFTNFTDCGECVYIATYDAPKELFPGLEQCFLANDLDDLLKVKLSKAADEGMTQLRYVDKEAAAMLIPKAIPKDWFTKEIIILPADSCEIYRAWLEHLWTYLRKQYPSDINVFSGLPVLPLGVDGDLKLVPLTLSSPCVIRSAMGVNLEDLLISTLEVFEIHLIEQLPDYVQCHAAVLGNFVKLPFREDLIDMLNLAYKKSRNSEQLLRNLHDNTSIQEKLAIVDMIASVAIGVLSKDAIDFLRKLPVFPSTHSSEESPDYVSCHQVLEGTKLCKLTYSPSQKLIDTSQANVSNAAKLLKVRIVEKRDLFTKLISSDIQQGKISDGNVRNIMSDIFRHFADYSDDLSFMEAIAGITFVPVGNGTLKKPAEVMDPRETVLKDFCCGEEGVFPVDDYATPQMLIHLNSLGMKSLSNLTSKDILERLFLIEDYASRDDNLEKVYVKSRAILSVICHRPELLLDETQGKILLDWSSSLSWVPIFQDPPDGYPENMKMKSDRYIAKPCDVKCTENLFLVGSVLGIVDGVVTHSVKDLFGWSELPQLSYVLRQLDLVVRNYVASDKGKYLALLHDIYTFLSKVNADELKAVMNEMNMNRWIWNGDGFADTRSCILRKSLIDLTPYIYSLPSEVLSFAELFRSHGVNEQCNTECLIDILGQIAVDVERQNGDETTHEKLLQQSIDILNNLKDVNLDDTQLGNILVPVQLNTHSGLKLMPAMNCTYCDVDWIRQGFDLMEFDEHDGITFIHPNLPIPTADKLGIPTLMSRMLHAEELAITGFGQGEPLTCRLKQLLEDYSDGLAIFKEMIQNADDAGAREINFVYDERHNLDSLKYLIDEGMKECQGAALWIHNDAVFSDHDFQSITKLGGATKETEAEKIGRFGLGFNSVYNLTDVPSFVSRSNIVIFDPHTKYLGKGIKDRSRPGIKIDMNKNKTLLKKLSDQFRPYQDMFGCDVQTEGVGYFNGTLFRLPLRSRQQAMDSEISDLHYDHEEMLSLLKLLVKHSHNLLLFTQHLEKLTIQHIPRNASPKVMREVFQLKKNVLQVIRQQYATPEPNTTSVTTTKGILTAAAQYIQKVKRPVKSRIMNVPLVPQSTILIQTSANVSENVLALNSELNKKEQIWLVSECVGQEISSKLALQSNHNLVPVGGVAILVRHSEEGFCPQSIQLPMKGLAFCFLPLPIPTGLPVQINGSFALETSRKHLSQRSDDDKDDFKAEWNEALLADAVCHAYIQGLWDLKNIIPCNKEVMFHEIWPKFDITEPYFHPLINSFYKNMSNLMKMPLCSRNGMILSMENVIFLDTPKSVPVDLKDAMVMAFTECNAGKQVLTLPKSIISSFQKAGYQELLTEKHFDVIRFYREILFPNVNTLGAELRDKLVIFALQSKKTVLYELVKSYKCIPVSPDGKVLDYISNLIHPTGLASKLYSEQDGRFPYVPFADGSILGCLQALGLHVNDVSWNDIVERAETIQSIYKDSNELGNARLQVLLGFIERKLLQTTQNKQTFRDMREDEYSEELLLSRDTLRNIPFLPAMKRPEFYPIMWHGDETSGKELYKACDLYPRELHRLVSATRIIVDEKHMTDQVKHFLGFTERTASIEQVLAQLEHVLAIDLTLVTSKDELMQIQSILFALYAFVDGLLKFEDDMAYEICDILRDRKCILVQHQFFAPSQLAMNFQYDCAPYLFALPQDTQHRFRGLMSKIGVREGFQAKDYVEKLQLLHSEANGGVLSDRQLDVSLRLSTQLNNTMKLSGDNVQDIIRDHGNVYIPNASGILQPSVSLCYNDCPWIKETQIMNFTHPDITFNTSACLGVKTKREEALSKYAKGIPFGQKERLTNSIKRILDTYPCDHEILKELIQNADDAQATEIHFIRDGRTHPDEHIFENSWKPLQGPSLCVYNNKPFSLSDLEGIQRLGEGSKSLDPSRTGQYGIGFSSVYHLSDAPSLLTYAEETGETLCVFDPHCYYVPGASQSEPGMQFTNVDQLWNAFPDVFNCYLTDQFDVKVGTMFRLPLRTSKMSETSKISKQHITLSRIRELLDKLKSEAFDILLFTNHLKTIKISDIDPLTGQISDTYTVSLHLTDEELQQRAGLAKFVNDNGTALKRGQFLSQDIPRQEFIFTFNLKDNLGKYEKWCVSQVIGFNNDQPVPDVITEAFRDGNLCLMPRGGVACLLEERVNQEPVSRNRIRKAFCFLPLPLIINLPVHVNGHFALGHENRRHLWNGDPNTYRQAWNNLLCSTVIPDAYLNMLKEIRMHGLNVKNKWASESSAVVECSRPILDSALSTYMTCFPTFSELHSEWNVLVKHVYLAIASSGSLVLPAVQEHVPTDSSSAQLHGMQWCVTWLSPTGEGREKAFFGGSFLDDDISEHVQSSSLLSTFRGIFRRTPAKKMVKTDSQILREVLVDCGFKLVDVPSNIVNAFSSSEVSIDFMCPEGVIRFFRSYSSENSMCEMGRLPAKLNDTSVRDIQTLEVLLAYCKKDPDFVKKLDGLPLLLTEDGMLRVFDSQKPVFHNCYSDLVPERGDLFMAQNLLKTSFNGLKLEGSPVCVEFKITDFESILPMKLPVDKLRTGEAKPWSRSFTGIPSSMWLKRAWSFIHSTLGENIDKDCIDSVESKPDILQSIKPLSEWSILPAQTPTKSYLFPLSKGCEVIYYSPDDRWHPFQKVLRKLKIPELDVSAIVSENLGVLEVAKELVTTLGKPQSVLLLLQTNLVQSGVMLSKQEANTILEYFVENIGHLTNSDFVKILRDLRLYTTICGDVINLTDCVVYTLPAKMPTEGIDIWQSRSGTVFLERIKEFQSLYDFLGCASISVMDVYCQFIFQHLEYFPEDDRIVHLYHVYSKYIKDGAPNHGDLTEEERESLQNVLKEMCFVDDGSGELHPASEFYDPENVVFKVMLTDEKFPPPVRGHLFKESEWYDFLGKLGLVREMNRDMFVEFANRIANEGHIHDKNAAEAKSKVLVEHLYSMAATARQSILPEVCDINFVAQAEVTPDLRNVYPQYGDVGTNTLHFDSFRNCISKRYEKIMWTQAPILPSWADPFEKRNLHSDEQQQIVTGLQMRTLPPVTMVVEHLLTLSRHLADEGYHPDVNSVSTMEGVFKAIYAFLRDNLGDDGETKHKLANEAIVLVSPKQLVKPDRIVVNLIEDDEIRPFLYKLPLNLGEFAMLFRRLGATERASTNQYAMVLESFKNRIGIKKLTINGMTGVFKAMKGLLEAIETHTSRDISIPVLYLPNEVGHLVDSSKLVFNDAPSFYDRVKEFKLQFIVDPRECGLRSRHSDELLSILPQRVRPMMLSAFVKEALLDECKRSANTSGLAEILDKRIRSEHFLRAVARLVRHEAQKTGQKINEESMFNVLDRLSTIHIVGVNKIVTHLTFRDKHIDGSEVEKACFVEKLQGPKSDMFEWHLYIKQDSALNQDLLVPLAEIINNILSGMLRDSVLYLLPILSCKLEHIHAKLDSLNIKLDRVQPSSRGTSLPMKPTLGTEIEDDLALQLKRGDFEFTIGEYVGFRNDKNVIIHAKVMEEIESPNRTRMFLLMAGSDQNTVVASISQLYKYY